MGGGRWGVLHSGALGIELARDIGFGDSVVVRGENVAGKAERAGPDPIGEVDGAEGVKGGRAGGFAAERGVG